MKRIKFTATEKFECDGRNQGPVFEEGSIHLFEDAFADRWLRRNVAVLVTDEDLALIDGGGDEIDKLKGPGLKKLAQEMQLTIAPGAKVDDIRAAIRAAIAAKASDDAGAGDGSDGLDDLDDDALLGKVAEAGIEIAQDADRPAILAALRAQPAQL